MLSSRHVRLRVHVHIRIAGSTAAPRRVVAVLFGALWALEPKFETSARTTDQAHGRYAARLAQEGFQDFLGQTRRPGGRICDFHTDKLWHARSHLLGDAASHP